FGRDSAPVMVRSMSRRGRARSESSIPVLSRPRLLRDSSLALLFDAFLPRRFRNARFDSRALRHKRSTKQFGEPLQDVRAVQFLTSRALRHNLQHTVFVDPRCEPSHDPPLLIFTENSRARHVERECDFTADLIHILTAGSAAPRCAKRNFV